MAALADEKTLVGQLHNVQGPTCPGCGHNRPIRSLILCRECWKLLPPYVQLAAYEARKTDKRSCDMGEAAVAVMVALFKSRKSKGGPVESS